ncbi:MAG: hypothetical protein ACO3EZ_09895 [Prochlorotrichaceae cyanobacterium]
MGLCANWVQAIGFPRGDRPHTEISKSGSARPLKGCRRNPSPENLGREWAFSSLAQV